MSDQTAQVDCREVSAELDRQFAANPPEIPAEVRRHLDGCPACRKLYAWISAKWPTGSMSTGSGPAGSMEGSGAGTGDGSASAVEARIREQLAADLTPVRPLPSVGESVLRFLGVFALIVSLLVWVWAAQGLVRMPTPQSMAMMTIVMAGAALLSISLARQMRPGSRRWMGEGPLMALVGAALLAGFGMLFPWRQVGDFTAEGWNCLVPGVAMAVPTAAVMWFVARRGVPHSLIAMGVAVGALGGLLGMAALEFSCNNDEALHLMVWHTGVLAASSAFGALAGYAADRYRRRAV